MTTAAAALLAAVALAALPSEESHAQDADASRGALVLVVKAGSGWFSSMVRGTGFLVPRAEAVVNLEADGYQISEVLVGEGDQVTSGQVLARLTRLAGDAPSPGGAGAQQRPATMPLRAPAAGRVTRSTAKVGAVASPMPMPPPMGPEPLFRIMVNNELEVEVEAPSIHVPKLSPGQTARVDVEGGRALTGRVRLVFPEIDRRTQLGKVRLTVDNDPSLRTGMFVRATIDASRSYGVSVPRSAVLYRTEGTSVQVVRNNVIETRRIRLGFLSDTDVEVRDGVTEGDLVVANAGTSLHNGDRVKPIFADDLSRAGAR